MTRQPRERTPFIADPAQREELETFIRKSDEAIRRLESLVATQTEINPEERLARAQARAGKS